MHLADRHAWQVAWVMRSMSNFGNFGGYWSKGCISHTRDLQETRARNGIPPFQWPPMTPRGRIKVMPISFATINDYSMKVIAATKMVRPTQGCDLWISNIDIDIDTIDDTSEVSISISTILSCRSIESGIDDTFVAVFSRYIDIDSFELI